MGSTRADADSPPRAASSLLGSGPIVATAWLLGEGIRPAELPGFEVLSRAPFTLGSPEAGVVVLYRFGAAVRFGTEGASPLDLPSTLSPLVLRPFERPESDSAEIGVDPDAREGVDRRGGVTLAEASVERLHVVADVLSRSAMLAHYEARLSASIDRLEPVAERLRRGEVWGLRSRKLLGELGESLISEMRMVGRAEVSEKPERVWDRPDLDALYVGLAHEYELANRDAAVTRKLELLARTSSLFLDMLASRRSLHVEWYIVILIVFEILLVVYEKWGS